MLIKAARFNNVKKAKFALGHGANVNTPDRHGLTPLMRASGNGYIDMVKLLIKNFAKINIRNKRGRTALIYASRGSLLRTYKRDRNGQTYEDITYITNKNHVKVIKLLLKLGANVNIKDKKGNTALYYAKKFKHNKIVKILKDHNAE